MTKEPSNEVSLGNQAFPSQLELAQSGAGSKWMKSEEGIAFAEYAFSLGFGVSKMEAYAEGKSRGKLQLYHQILGIDDEGENWKDHMNPEFALILVKKRIMEASKAVLILKYKFWLDLPLR